MVVSEKKKEDYIRKVHNEMKKRGFTENETEKVIGKTGFMKVLNMYPEEQMHYSVSDAVDEIILTASKK